MSLRRDGHFAAGGQERKRSYTPATIAKKPAGNQAILNFPHKVEIVKPGHDRRPKVAPCGATSNGERSMSRILLFGFAVTH
jgi:hypothetical protein